MQDSGKEEKKIHDGASMIPEDGASVIPEGEVSSIP